MWWKVHWCHPHQLPHTGATSILRRFGHEATQTYLGNSEVGTAQIYAEKTLETARAVMRQTRVMPETHVARPSRFVVAGLHTLYFPCTPAIFVLSRCTKRAETRDRRRAFG